MWENQWGETFETEKDARNNVHEHITKDDYELELGYLISYGRLLKWAMEQDAFYEKFQNEISKVENIFFEEYYCETEDE